MKTITLTFHVIDQVRARKKISWEKAKAFLKSKIREMRMSPDKKILDAWDWAHKIIVWKEKIVYKESKSEIVLITYILKTEYDIIEHNLLNLIKYYEKKNWDY